MRKKIITLGSVALIITTLTAFSTLYGKCISGIDSMMIKFVDERIERDPRFDCIDQIKEDIREIKLMIAFMNRNNPEYEKTVKALKGGSEK